MVRARRTIPTERWPRAVVAPPRRLRAAAVPLVVGVLLVGCGKTMSEGDCERVGRHIAEVWDADVKATAPSSDEAKSERAKLVLSGERERMKSEWMTQCRRELDGRKVDDKEFECLLAANTIADLQACAAPKKR